MTQINSLPDFIKAMPTDLDSIIAKVRHLYLELGKRSFYDTEYKYCMFGEEDGNYTYTSKPYYNPNIIICTTLAKQFSKLLTLAGIKNELKTEENGAHYFVEFYDEEDRAHKTDITNDLKNIQFGCKTEYFGKDTISEEELKDQDMKLGYISPERGYSNDGWYVVKETLEKNAGLNKKQQLEIVMQNLQRFGDITKPRS